MSKIIEQLDERTWTVTETLGGITSVYNVYDENPEKEEVVRNIEKLDTSQLSFLKTALGISGGGGVTILAGDNITVTENMDGSYTISSTVTATDVRLIPGNGIDIEYSIEDDGYIISSTGMPPTSYIAGEGITFSATVDPNVIQIDAGVSSITAGPGIVVNQSAGDFTISSTGVEIKTINRESVLGSGNISITQGRNRYQGVRSPYIVRQDQAYLGAPIIESTIANVSSLVMFNTGSGTQYLRLYASQSSSSIVGAMLIGYFSTTGYQFFSGVFTRQFHTFFSGGESEGESYGYYAIRAISPNYSVLSDVGTQTSNYGEILVGDVNGITHPHLILHTTGHDIQNWICEWSSY